MEHKQSLNHTVWDWSMLKDYRYVLLDAGPFGQKIYLAATALHLGVVGVCGFYNDKMKNLLFVDGRNKSTL